MAQTRKEKFIEGLKNPSFMMVLILNRLAPYIKNDELFLKLKFYFTFKKRLDLNNPKTYNEKLQWLKLYDRKPEYTNMVDKVTAKEYVASIIGEKYIIPTLGVWDKFEKIDFDLLPNQFVLKCSHDSGGVIVCKDKRSLNIAHAKKVINFGLNKSHYWGSREWPYKNVHPRIIGEQYMEDESGYELKDYKFFCFDGKPIFLFVATDREKEGEETKFDFFDMEWNHLPIINGHPNNPNSPQKPENFKEMIQISEKLSQGFPHLRVDLYNINGKIYFGELTFFHWSGFVPFEPEEWDEKLGEMLILPKGL